MYFVLYFFYFFLSPKHWSLVITVTLVCFLYLLILFSKPSLYTPEFFCLDFNIIFFYYLLIYLFKFCSFTFTQSNSFFLVPIFLCNLCSTQSSVVISLIHLSCN